MKKKDFKDLKEKSIKDLKKMVFEKKSEVGKKSMETLSGKEKNPKLVRNLKRDIARIMTLISEKEIVEKLGVKGEGQKVKVEEKEKKVKKVKKEEEK